MQYTYIHKHAIHLHTQAYNTLAYTNTQIHLHTQVHCSPNNIVCIRKLENFFWLMTNFLPFSLRHCTYVIIKLLSYSGYHLFGFIRSQLTPWPKLTCSYFQTLQYTVRYVILYISKPLSHQLLYHLGLSTSINLPQKTRYSQ